MARGGKRAGAGRKKGSATKRTRKTSAIAERAAGEGVLPLQVLLEAMREQYEARDLLAAAKIAREAAPYVHPRLAAVTHKGDKEAPIRLVEELVIVDAGADPHAAAAGPRGPGGVPPQ